MSKSLIKNKTLIFLYYYFILEANKNNGTEISLEAVECRPDPVVCPSRDNKKLKSETNIKKKDRAQ